VEGGNASLAVSLVRTIAGSVTIQPAGDSGAACFASVGSILHAALVGGKYGAALDAPGSAVDIQASTLFGGARVYSVRASNAIFMAPLRSERRQIGCVRFSYVPAGSRTPRRFRCQPDLALMAEARRLGKESVADLTNAERAVVIARLIPAFTSRQYGIPPMPS